MCQAFLQSCHMHREHPPGVVPLCLPFCREGSQSTEKVTVLTQGYRRGRGWARWKSSSSDFTARALKHHPNYTPKLDISTTHSDFPWLVKLSLISSNFLWGLFFFLIQGLLPILFKITVSNHNHLNHLTSTSSNPVHIIYIFLSLPTYITEPRLFRGWFFFLLKLQ